MDVFRPPQRPAGRAAPLLAWALLAISCAALTARAASPQPLRGPEARSSTASVDMQLPAARQWLEQAKSRALAAEAQWAEARAELERAQSAAPAEAAADNSSAATVLPAPVVNPRWQALQQRYETLLAERDSLLQRMTDQHPEVMALGRQLLELDQRLMTVPEFIVPGDAAAPAVIDPAQRATAAANDPPSKPQQSGAPERAALERACAAARAEMTTAHELLAAAMDRVAQLEAAAKAVSTGPAQPAAQSSAVSDAAAEKAPPASDDELLAAAAKDWLAQHGRRPGATAADSTGEAPTTDMAATATPWLFMLAAEVLAAILVGAVLIRRALADSQSPPAEANAADLLATAETPETFLRRDAGSTAGPGARHEQNAAIRAFVPNDK